MIKFTHKYTLYHRFIRSPLLLAHLMSGLLSIHVTFKKSHDIKDGDTGETGSCLFYLQKQELKKLQFRQQESKRRYFISKHSLLLDNVNHINKLCLIPTTVCRNCYSKITDVHDCLQDIRNCISKYLEEGSIRVKRCTSSPFNLQNPQSCGVQGYFGCQLEEQKAVKTGT